MKTGRQARDEQQGQHTAGGDTDHQTPSGQDCEARHLGEQQADTTHAPADEHLDRAQVVLLGDGTAGDQDQHRPQTKLEHEGEGVHCVESRLQHVAAAGAVGQGAEPCVDQQANRGQRQQPAVAGVVDGLEELAPKQCREGRVGRRPGSDHPAPPAASAVGAVTSRNTSSRALRA